MSSSKWRKLKRKTKFGNHEIDTFINFVNRKLEKKWTCDKHFTKNRISNSKKIFLHYHVIFGLWNRQKVDENWKDVSKMRDANTENSSLHYHTNCANRSRLHIPGTTRKSSQNHVKMQSVKLCWSFFFLFFSAPLQYVNIKLFVLCLLLLSRNIILLENYLS
jgi:hypothetical protein